MKISRKPTPPRTAAPRLSSASGRRSWSRGRVGYDDYGSMLRTALAWQPLPNDGGVHQTRAGSQSTSQADSPTQRRCYQSAYQPAARRRPHVHIGAQSARSGAAFLSSRLSIAGQESDRRTWAQFGPAPSIGHDGAPGSDRCGCYIHARASRTDTSPPIWGHGGCGPTSVEVAADSCGGRDDHAPFGSDVAVQKLRPRVERPSSV